MNEIKPQVNTHIVEMLEGLLKGAKRGEIQGAAVAGVRPDGTTFNYFALGGHVMALLGEHRVLERDMIDGNVDIRRAPMWEYCE